MSKTGNSSHLTAHCFALALILGVSQVTGTTVYFDDTDRGPHGLLQIGDVAVSPYDSGELFITAQPATVSGMGLGSGAIGPLWSVDRQMHYSTNEIFPDADTLEGLTLSVDGQINSITVLPMFSVLGGGEPVALGFDILVSGNDGTVNFARMEPSSPNPITITFEADTGGSLASAITLYIQGNSRQDLNFAGYRQSYSPDETFVFGVSIKSLDYTAVPEASTTALLVAGLFGLLWAGRKRRRPRKWTT